MFNSIQKWVISATAQYLITDSYGTVKYAYTRREALAWLAACSPDARVWRCALLGCNIVMARNVERVF